MPIPPWVETIQSPEFLATPDPLSDAKTLCQLVAAAHPRHGKPDDQFGHTYQNGVVPGSKKLGQFRECLKLQNTPLLFSQESLGEAAVVWVKLFDPCGNWTWLITEWDGANLAFGLVHGHEKEFGYIDLGELAEAKGRMGIGIELDMHFKPARLSTVRT